MSIVLEARELRKNYLGGDGSTPNASAPRQGPNDLQNHPVIVTGADGTLRGWLGGSQPGATYHLEFFAAAYRIPLPALKNREQGRRMPDAPAAAYLLAIKRRPKEIMEAVARP